MFNVLLKELRAKKGMTQAQLAKAIGVSPGNVGDWETGKSKPGYTALATLSRIFEVSADYLLELKSPHVDASGDKLTSYKKEQGLICDESPLTDEEADVVAMYRLLPPMHRHEVYDYVFFKYQRHVEGERGFFSSAYTEEGAAIQSGPGEAGMPTPKPPNFFRCFCLVLNHFLKNCKCAER